MADRSSRPHASPRRTPTRTELRIIKGGVLRRWGPARIAHVLRRAPFTVHRLLTRYGPARRTHADAPPATSYAATNARSQAYWCTSASRSSATSPTVEATGLSAACCRSHDWRDALAAPGIAHKRPRAYRPQTNGKVERFNRVLLTAGT